MATKKKGEKYECEECGMIVVVDSDSCDCEECDIVCCDVPMVLVEEKKKVKRTAAKKAKPKAKATKYPH